MGSETDIEQGHLLLEEFGAPQRLAAKVFSVTMSGCATMQ
jgi:hypothetical protein